MQSYKRSTRVGELLLQEISRIVLELPEPQLGFVTITGVKLSDDLQSAQVFYSVIGSPDDVRRSQEIMEHAGPEIRHQLALRLNLRRTPTLTFHYDETPERATRIFSLLEKIRTENEEPREPEAPKPEPGKKKARKKE